MDWSGRTAALLLMMTGVLATSGCVSPQQMLAKHRAVCATYGFQPATEGYANCLLQMEVSDYGYSHHGARPIFVTPSPPPAPTPP